MKEQLDAVEFHHAVLDRRTVAAELDTCGALLKEARALAAA